MRQKDDLAIALEELRHRPIVTESREYAGRWERSASRAARLRKAALRSVGAIAAAGVIACMGWWLLPAISGRAETNLITTGIGETRTLTLSDGSRILLDTSSRLRIVYSSTTRGIELLGGQAHFEVAKDPQRPFRVHTKAVEVVAVGTQFDVAELAARTTVTLIEGRVNVRTIPGAPNVRPRLEAMSPGQQLGISSAGELLDKREVKVENVTAWQRGTIVLDDMPLADALAALNRYSTTRIVIDNNQLQSRRISGVFHVGDVETEAIALERYFGLKESARSERAIVLAPR